MFLLKKLAKKAAKEAEHHAVRMIKTEVQRILDGQEIKPAKEHKHRKHNNNKQYHMMFIVVVLVVTNIFVAMWAAKR